MVFFAYNEEGLKQLEKDFQTEGRNVKELKELRFNNDPIENKEMKKDEILNEIKKEPELVVEFSTDKILSRCILNSPKYSDILPKKVKVLRIDSEMQPEICEKYEVYTIPTLLIFKNGQLHGRIAGCCSGLDEKVLKNKLSKLL